MIHTRVVPLFLLSLLVASLGACACEPAPKAPAHAEASPTPIATPAPAPEPAPQAEPVPTTVAAQPLDSPRTLASGLTITEHTAGAGEPCPPIARVTINFTAKLASGVVWDSTDQRKVPLTMELTSPGLIAGLREGIIGMRPGARRTLNIPYKLAYGDAGREPVPPKTDLVFEVELLKWEPGQEAPPGDEAAPVPPTSH